MMKPKHHPRGTKEYIAEGMFTFHEWVRDASVLRLKLTRLARSCDLKASDFTWKIYPNRLAPEAHDPLETESLPLAEPEKISKPKRVKAKTKAKRKVVKKKVKRQT